jgi:hypothetical protein
MLNPSSANTRFNENYNDFHRGFAQYQLETIQQPFQILITSLNVKNISRHAESCGYRRARRASPCGISHDPPGGMNGPVEDRHYGPPGGRTLGFFPASELVKVRVEITGFESFICNEYLVP